MFGHDVVFVHSQAVGDKELSLEPGETHHLTRVLRKRVGETFGAIDGAGKAFICELSAVEKTIATANILEILPEQGEPVFRLTLAIAPPKKPRYELLLEKCTEVGVTRFVPIITERTSSKDDVIRPDRVQKILLAAIKQCGRSRLPVYSEAMAFDVFLSQITGFDVKYLAHEGAWQNSMSRAAPVSGGRGVLCIGPEGGFTASEVDAARAVGFEIIGLGPRRLRSETAAIAGCSIMLCSQSS